MKAIAAFFETKEIKLIDHPEPEITKPNELKMRVIDTGVCGTDKEIARFLYGTPPKESNYLILGHESMMKVVKTGEAVKKFKKGDLVVPSVRRPCNSENCEPCRNGLQDFCSSGEFTERGIMGAHGFMTECVVEEEEFLNLVPHNLREFAVLVEPLTITEKAIAELVKVQSRLPWILNDEKPGAHKTALMLGAGPVGILAAMAFLKRGFRVFMYSQGPSNGYKAKMLEKIGVGYLSTREIKAGELKNRIGNVDVVYEAVGDSKLSFEVLKYLGNNGVFIFTGIPDPQKIIEIDSDNLMRNIVLKNQLIFGTVNADRESFRGAVEDLIYFKKNYPSVLEKIITKRYKPGEFRKLLLESVGGIRDLINFEDNFTK